MSEAYDLGYVNGFKKGMEASVKSLALFYEKIKEKPANEIMSLFKNYIEDKKERMVSF